MYNQWSILVSEILVKFLLYSHIEFCLCVCIRDVSQAKAGVVRRIRRASAAYRT